MDYKAEQEMEVEALQAILMDEFAELESGRPSGWPTDAPSYIITVLPSQEDTQASTSDVEMGAEIVFAHTPTYPDEAPLVKARSIRGLSPDDLAQLQALLEQTVQDNLGMAMIYALVSAAQDWLRDRASADGGAEELDPEEERKRAEEAEERKLAEIRSHGTLVTPDTFAAWKQRFDTEMAAARARLQDAGAKQVDKGPTGKQFFLQQEALGKEAVEEDEEDFQDEDYEEEGPSREAEREEEESSEDDDFDPDEEDDEDEDDAMLDEYLSKRK